MTDVSAQTIREQKNWDSELWLSARVNFKLNDRWKIKTDHQFRAKEIYTQFDRVLSELEVELKLNKNFSTLVGGRYIGLNDNRGTKQGFESQVRFHADLEHHFQFQRFEFQHRLRYQNRNDLQFNESETNPSAHDFRYKLSVGYDVKRFKWNPSLGLELFYHHEVGQLDGFRRYRIFAEMERNLKGSNKISIFYMLENETTLLNPKSTHVIGLKYTHTFKRKQKIQADK